MSGIERGQVGVQIDVVPPTPSPRRSPFAGHVHSPATIIRMTETRRGRQLSDDERREIFVRVEARHELVERVSQESVGTEQVKPRIYGKIGRAVLPLLQQGMPIPAISEQTGYTPMQVSNARGRLRNSGLLGYVTKEERLRIFQEVYRRLRPSFAGHTHSQEALRKIREKSLGRKLTEVEIEQLRILATARQIVRSLSLPTYSQLCERHGRKPRVQCKNRMFLESFTAVRQCEAHREEWLKLRQRLGDLPPLLMRDVDRVYEQIDPDVFRRLKGEIDFIREMTARVSIVFQRKGDSRERYDEKTFRYAQRTLKRMGADWKDDE